MQNVKLLTIDVWDTLIRRSCHPDEVKLHLCRYVQLRYHNHLKVDCQDIATLLAARQEAEAEIGVAKKEQGFDDEYSLIEVYRVWLNKIFEDASDVESVCNMLREVELRQEYYVTYRDPEILNLLNQYKEAEKIFVSDFYMPSADILSILKKNGLGSIIQRGYSSCDVNINKRSGKLFGHVLDFEGKSNKEILHIGDNIHSDVNMARALGINTIHYMPKLQHNLRMEKEERIGQFNQILHNTLKALTEDCLYRNNTRQSEMYRAGINYSGLVVGFALYVMEQAIKLKHDKVFFFTREGEFFRQVYDTLAEQDPFGIPAPSSELLEVSRIATFSASLQHVTIESLMRLWSLYSTQSLAALFTSLDVEGEQFSDFLLRYDLNMIDDIQYPWLDPRIQALFKDVQFTSELGMQLNAKRTNLMGYLAEKKFPMLGKAAIVDIGWRGTIQDNLAHLLPNVHIDGFYLGLDKFINQQPSNVNKFSFGPNLNRNENEYLHMFSKVSPIEMLCNSPNGSVIGYLNIDNHYSAKRLVVNSENAAYHSAVIYFQQGAIDAAKVISQKIRLHSIPVMTFREIAIRNWLDICLKPPAAIADAYFNLRHNESFGLGRFEDKTVVIPTIVWVKGLFSIGGFKFLVSSLEKTGWPEGYLAKRGLGWFWILVNFLRNLIKK